MTTSGLAEEELTKLDLLRVNLLTGDGLDQLPEPEPLLAGILFRNTIATLYGPPGVGKTFVAVGWDLSIATGSWWMGREVVKGPVLYIAAEGTAGLAKRRRAWMTAERVCEVAGDYWLPRSVNLLDEKWSGAVAELALEIGAVLVVIDTVSRSMPGGDENSSRDMGALIAAADGVRRRSGATVLLVHHTPRNGDNPRGHSSLEGAVDTAIEIRPDENGFTLRCAKQKDAPKFADLRLALRPAGDSCVVSTPTYVEAEMPEMARTMLESLAESDLGDGLSSTRWRAVSGVAERSAFRWQKKLVDLGHVGTIGEGRQKRYTVTEQGRQAVTE